MLEGKCFNLSIVHSCSSKPENVFFDFAQYLVCKNSAAVVRFSAGGVLYLLPQCSFSESIGLKYSKSTPDHNFMFAIIVTPTLNLKGSIIKFKLYLF